MRRILAALVPLTLIFIMLGAIQSQDAGPRVLTVSIEGAITTATASLVEEAITRAEREGHQAIVILLNTPGGLLSATMQIIDAMERSQVPVIVFIYPRGARGWSAGTYIAMASHIAAMAPNTIIGSSQPVSYSPLTGSEPVEDPKTLNALSAFMVERARMHGRNETAAKLFVVENLNLNDEQALRYRVIEVRASSLEELLVKVDGMKVEVVGGEAILRTRGAHIDGHEPSLRLRLLSVLTDPILAPVALLVGLYALIFGISSPGYAAEIIGAFLLIMGLIGLGFNVNLASLLLLAIGAILMIAEAYTPGFGVLGGAGLLFTIVGSLLLIPFEAARWIIAEELYNLFLMVIIAASSIIGGFTLFMVYKVVMARRRKPFLGEMIGGRVQAIDEIAPGKTGFVKYEGEYWMATSNGELKPGHMAIIVGRDGPVLRVKPLGEEASPSGEGDHSAAS